ncbi:MAG: sigma-70 family RNA polymerase sigma factor [Terriglobia bacterium]
MRMVNNAAEAEDLTQEAFMQLFRKISTFRGEAAFSTWFHRLAMNIVLMHKEKGAGRNIPGSRSAEDDQDLPKKEYGEDDLHLKGAVDRIALDKAIADLPRIIAILVLRMM